MTRSTRPDLAALYASLAPGLLLYTRQLVAEKSEAEDLLHEAFVRLFSQVSVPPEPKPWLVLTIRRLASDKRKAIFRRRRRETQFAKRETQFAKPDLFLASADSRLDAEWVASLISKLPERQREVLTLRTWNDLTLSQIAALLSISVSTAHADLTQAVATLRRELDSFAPRTHVSERSSS